MNKLIVSIFVCTSTFVQCSLSEKIALNQNKIQTIKANLKAGKLPLNDMDCDPKCVTTGCLDCKKFCTLAQNSK